MRPSTWARTVTVLLPWPCPPSHEIDGDVGNAGGRVDDRDRARRPSPWRGGPQLPSAPSADCHEGDDAHYRGNRGKGEKPV